METRKICKVQNHEKRKIMQSEKLSKLPNYDIMQDAKVSDTISLKFIDTKETRMILVVLFRFYETGSVKPGSIGGTKPKVEMAISAN